MIKPRKILLTPQQSNYEHKKNMIKTALKISQSNTKLKAFASDKDKEN